MASSSDNKNNSSSYQGKAVEITKNRSLGSGTRVTIDVEKLQNIFCKYEDYPVAVYTVSGPFRTGKSFLLNLLIRYLKNLQQNQDFEFIDLLGPLNEEISNGFEFKSGESALTKGIQILDEPFLIDCHIEGKMQKVALFLVDTQGSNDTTADQRDSLVIGTMNFLLGSFLCFNMRSRIEKSSLQHLFNFASKFMDIVKQEKDAACFQEKSLMFLVRDWLDDDEDVRYPYGFEGGEKYFKKVTEHTEEAAEEHKMLFNFFQNNFGNTSCFLMPEPGKAVRKKPVVLENLERDYLVYVVKLFKHLLNPQNIIVKEIGGKTVTCKELCESMEVVAAFLNSDMSLDDPNSLIKITYESQMHSLTSKCARNFLKRLQEDIKMDKPTNVWKKLLRGSRESFEQHEIEQELKKLKEAALREYDELPKCGDSEYEESWRNDLCNLLDQITEAFMVVNDLSITAKADTKTSSAAPLESQNLVKSLSFSKSYTSKQKCANAERQFVEGIKEFNNWINANTMTQNITDEDYKQAAKDKREEILKKLKENMTEFYYDQCYQPFKDQTNLLLAETQEEVNDYLKLMEVANFAMKVIFGVLVIAQQIIKLEVHEVGKKLETLDEELDNWKEKKVSQKKILGRFENVRKEAALSKYFHAAIEVKLCFGIITITLESRISLDFKEE